MSGALPPPPGPDLPRDSGARAVRAQLLATEHWSLLASRSTAQSEVLTRIQMHLTLVSAVLLTLGLFGQALGFAPPFPVLACVLLTIVLLVGILTQVRVVNAGNEDLGYVLAMNRLRGAYERLSPGIDAEFATAATDDIGGAALTYYTLATPRGPSQALGSSAVFSIVVDAVLAGLLCGTIAVSAGGGVPLALVLGLVVALAFGAVSILLLGRTFTAARRGWTPRYPSQD